jgi:hypothetical protein
MLGQPLEYASNPLKDRFFSKKMSRELKKGR